VLLSCLPPVGDVSPLVYAADDSEVSAHPTHGFQSRSASPRQSVG